MPVTVKKQRGQYRVVEADTGKIAKNKGGTALDGGGHGEIGKTKAQARAVNRSLGKKGKI